MTDIVPVAVLEVPSMHSGRYTSGMTFDIVKVSLFPEGLK
jgi:hypothetical protein